MEFLVPQNQYISLEDLNDIKLNLSETERFELERKCNEIVNSIFYSSYESRLVAKDAFEKGYLAARIKYEKV